MGNIRIIPRLDIKGPNLIKGIHLEGLRVIGNPKEYARHYYETGADELIYMDAVATLYGRNHLAELIKNTVEDIFIPVTVGGGIRSVDDVKELLRAGADKVAINTAAVEFPELITKISRKFGSQCMVLSIEAMKVADNKWHVFTHNGREVTGLDVVEWACQAVELGAGEILLTSIDCEGTRRGFDLSLIKAVSSAITVPVIASGGLGKPSDLVLSVQNGGADAVAVAAGLHYGDCTMLDLRNSALKAGLNVRNDKLFL